MLIKNVNVYDKFEKEGNNMSENLIEKDNIDNSTDKDFIFNKNNFYKLPVKDRLVIK